MSPQAAPVVAATVVTYNRRAVLAATLTAVLAQSTPPSRVIVVDNGSDDGTLDMLAADFPGVRVLRLPDNQGYGAGLAAGMRLAVGDGADLCWLLDDDSAPAPRALEVLTATLASFPGAGMAGYHGSRLWWGVPRSQSLDGVPRVGTVLDSFRVYRRDCMLVDGSLVPRRTVEAAGYPRPDLFMMMEDVDYTARVRRTGADLLVVQPDLISRAHLGSSGSARPSPPWRQYYQTRNHLLIARANRSPREVVGWVLRQARFAVHDVRTPHGRTRIRYRLLGARDGIRGRTGRTVNPATGR